MLSSHVLMLCFHRVPQTFGLDFRNADFGFQKILVRNTGTKETSSLWWESPKFGYWRWLSRVVSSECEIMNNSDIIHGKGARGWPGALSVWISSKGLEGVCAEQLWREERPMVCTYKLGELLLYGHYIQLIEGVFVQKVCVRGVGEPGRGESWRWWEGREGALTSPHSPDCVPIWRSGISTLTT